MAEREKAVKDAAPVVPRKRARLAGMAAAFLLMASALFPVLVRAGELVEIRLIIGCERLPLLLEDSAASRDFLEMLPLRVTLRDYNGTEKIGDLPGRLSTQGAPAGYEPAAGDVALYAPWGNIALFYRDFPWSVGLVRLGRLQRCTERLAAMSGEFTAVFERAE